MIRKQIYKHLFTSIAYPAYYFCHTTKYKYDKVSALCIAECLIHKTFANLRFPEIVREEMKNGANPAFFSKIKINDKEIRPELLSRKWNAKSPEIFVPLRKFTTAKKSLTKEISITAKFFGEQEAKPKMSKTPILN